MKKIKEHIVAIISLFLGAILTLTIEIYAYQMLPFSDFLVTIEIFVFGWGLFVGVLTFLWKEGVKIEEKNLIKFDTIMTN